jgi:predicted TIM-barrel fold metal-dependent hydrolase
MLLYGVEPAKVLYGTDWPISSMETYLAFMQELALPAAERRGIMADNAIKLFGLDPANSLISRSRVQS